MDRAQVARVPASSTELAVIPSSRHAARSARARAIASPGSPGAVSRLCCPVSVSPWSARSSSTAGALPASRSSAMRAPGRGSARTRATDGGQDLVAHGAGSARRWWGATRAARPRMWPGGPAWRRRRRVRAGGGRRLGRRSRGRRGGDGLSGLVDGCDGLGVSDGGWRGVAGVGAGRARSRCRRQLWRSRTGRVRGAGRSTGAGAGAAGGGAGGSLTGAGRTRRRRRGRVGVVRAAVTRQIGGHRIGLIAVAADRSPEVANALAERLGHLGEAFGTQHQQRDDEDEQQVGGLKDVSDHDP